MLRPTLKYLLFILAVGFVYTCRKPFQPVITAAVAPNSILVVDGIVNTAPGGVSIIKLSRARAITDSTYDMKLEAGANVAIEGSGGNTYQLHQTDSFYKSDALNLDVNQTYRVHVSTSNGGQYLSEFVKVKQSPPIDSITWQQDNGVNIYAYTHDATNNTRYYRWDYTETYQHDAPFQISWGVKDHYIFSITNVTYETYTYHCWSDSNSTSIITGTSAALSEDVISKQLIKAIPDNDPKIGIRYSILVRQYALTPEAYQYWGIIQKNTQNIGTLFDVQPSQLFGNVSSLTNKNEPVIGFISAGSVAEKRIFIDHLDLFNWKPPLPNTYCPVINIPQNSNFLYYDYPDTTFVPYYFTSGGGLNITKKPCLDCRTDGGTNLKPAFWQ